MGNDANNSVLKPLRLLIALPGLHRVARGAETALEEIARHLAMREDMRVTVIGSGDQHEAAYEYRKASCVARERFEGLPALPLLRDHYMWEELTFSSSL